MGTGFWEESGGPKSMLWNNDNGAGTEEAIVDSRYDCLTHQEQEQIFEQKKRS